ncbi:MAG: hypothetical protein AAFV78_13060 [Bacteroidota bacterium]
MNFQRSIFIISLFLMMGLIACEAETDAVISDEEALEQVEAALVTTEGGITTQAVDAAELSTATASFYQNNCSFSGDSTFNYARSGGGRSVSFTYTYEWSIECEGIIPDIFKLETSYTGSYDGIRYDATIDGGGNYKVDQLLTGSEYLLSGEYNYTGMQEFQGRTTRSLNTTFEMAFSSVTVDKSTQEITGGTGTFSILAQGANGSRTVVGAFTYLGGGVAEVTINGTTYTVNL